MVTLRALFMYISRGWMIISAGSEDTLINILHKVVLVKESN